ncbi:alpha/beta fold hydrolase [Amycolatopsis tucumanensis]|uniref:Alpha/beta hydrolase n=1 Tax=Amycolatopsis tucumanensis TaxID=401106 RepID=A0ABP7HI14_9PSEU|nr:alpha/beta hydrolase [Amycolatopsis tucumanensis]MCF6426403.1 alpha/beta hydrolase [Amycolatopsis tucumanensis]
MPITTSGIHYEVRGGGERTIVLLPGFGCSIECWAEVAPLLDGYRVVLMDLPGHAGSSGARADGDLARLAETVFEACREIGLTRFVVAGLSLGGAISVRIALDHPGEVEAVVGIMPWNAGGTSPGDPVIEGFYGAYGDLDTITAGIASISQDPAKTTDLVRTMPTVTERMWRGWLGGGVYTSMADELPGLRVPLLYLVGGKDTVVNLDKQISDVRRVPGGRLVLLADAGHLACYETPEVVAREMRQFLSDRAVAAV